MSEEKEEELEAPPTPEQVTNEILAEREQMEQTSDLKETVMKIETQTETQIFETKNIEKTETDEIETEKQKLETIKDGEIQIESPTTIEEQEKKLLDDIKKAEDAIRDDINNEKDEEKKIALTKSAIEIEQEIEKETNEEETIQEAVQEEIKELKQDLKEKKCDFKQKYIDQIKQEIYQVKEEIAKELNDPKPEEIQHIRQEIKKIEQDYKKAEKISQEPINNDASSLFDELKKRGTLRGVLVRTKIPEQTQKPTPQQIINKSLKQEQKPVPSAWELLQRKKRS